MVVTSGWPHPAQPAQCVFIRRQMESLRPLGIRYETLFLRGYRSKWAYIMGAARLLLLNFCRRRYDLVHCHGGEAAFAAAFYRRAPLLVSYLGSDLLYTSRRDDGAVSLANKVRCSIIRGSSCVAAGTITKSHEMELVLPRRIQVRNTVIPNGVDTTVFRPVARTEARAALGWPLDWRVVLFVGDPNEKRKRYSLAAAGVRRANAVLGNVRLIVVNGVDPHIVPLYMSASDCLVHVSWVEGSPNAVKEALMCNLPIVATAAGDVVQLLDGVQLSFVVDPDEAAVAEALVRCIAEPVRSDGRRKALELGSSAVAQRVWSMYKTLAPELERSPEPPRARRRRTQRSIRS